MPLVSHQFFLSRKTVWLTQASCMPFGGWARSELDYVVLVGYTDFGIGLRLQWYQTWLRDQSRQCELPPCCWGKLIFLLPFVSVRLGHLAYPLWRCLGGTLYTNKSPAPSGKLYHHDPVFGKPSDPLQEGRECWLLCLGWLIWSYPKTSECHFEKTGRGKRVIWKCGKGPRD